MILGDNKSLNRKIISSSASVVVSLSLVLFVVGLLALFLINTQKLSDYIKENIGFTIMLNDEISEIETIKFQKELEIADFTTYPNPFSNKTDIYFQHNKANNELDYVLDIYSITGVLVKKIEQSAYNSVGYRIGPISWDGKNEYGRKISAGMYIATLGVTDEDGNFSSKSTRIILLP